MTPTRRCPARTLAVAALALAAISCASPPPPAAGTSSPDARLVELDARLAATEARLAATETRLAEVEAARAAEAEATHPLIWIPSLWPPQPEPIQQIRLPIRIWNDPPPAGDCVLPLPDPTER